MKNFILLLFSVSYFSINFAQQVDPAISSWLINTTGITGQHYLAGNSTPILDTTSANISTVQFSSNWVYATTQGIPAYITGPFTANPNSVITPTNTIYQIPLNPVKNNGTLTNTGAGNIGVFKNGVGLFSYGDGFAYNPATNTDAPAPNGVWRRDAVKAEINGFDCSKAHPAAQGNYHHHQNPSAFNLDLIELSSICNLYTSDGLYVINPNEHSPILGFSYDGFPIYGAYAFADTIGGGGIVRMKSSYSLRNISVRTNYADGTDVVDGPPISATFPLGWYREDYEYIDHPLDMTYLDEHNGRFCVTPEYPNGIYCYFTTVDENHNSYYPYSVGPTYYGVKTGGKVNAITEVTDTYNPQVTEILEQMKYVEIKVYPNPSQDIVAIQSDQVLMLDMQAELIDAEGKIVQSKSFSQGTSICFFDTSTLYNGHYTIRIYNSVVNRIFQIVLQ